jgi:hypothetical protein
MISRDILKNVFLLLTNVSAKTHVMAWQLLVLSVMHAVVASVLFLLSVNLISGCIKKSSFVNIADVSLLIMDLQQMLISNQDHL